MRPADLLRLQPAGYPVAGFPAWVHAHGATIAVVNIGPTGADQTASVRLELKTGDALPALVTRLAPPDR